MGAQILRTQPGCVAQDDPQHTSKTINSILILAIDGKQTATEERVDEHRVIHCRGSHIRGKTLSYANGGFIGKANVNIGRRKTLSLLSRYDDVGRLCHCRKNIHKLG
ncbi:hypothetical protein AAHA92_25844 [Salvia divinorum]|uniref:Uncharacterized protein n=1 Tax=Salvia divinorum TaxID=28513 RepID=A0ABD1GC11_SALDI